jgi:hypothetical protein
MHHLTGVTSFSIDPYQIGYQNEEGIESGAFWFYRKLGFRPTQPAVLQLVEKEEQQIATRKDYRTSARTLRKLAESPMIFELDQRRAGDWDEFHVRKIGLRRQGLKFESLESLFPKVSWSRDEKRMLEQIVRSKSAAEETTYLDLMRQHERLRAEIIKLGS